MSDLVGLISIYFTGYVAFLGIFSGLVCWLLYSRMLQNENFPIESKIAKYGGMAYIFLSIVLYLIGRLTG
ncbi:MAG TPA: hypothetical protein GXX38_02050 [Clostridia bacterium]|nr:hypothetical protein [Clostridia bacterium]